MYHQSSAWSFSDSSYIIWKMLAPLIYMAVFHCHWIGNFVLEWRNSCYTRPILKGIFFLCFTVSYWPVFTFSLSRNKHNIIKFLYWPVFTFSLSRNKHNIIKFSYWPVFTFSLSRNKHNIIKVQYSFISTLFNNVNSASTFIRNEEFLANQQNTFCC